VAKSVLLDWSWLPLSENPDDHPQKRTVQPGHVFEDTSLKPGFKDVKLKPGCRVSALYYFVKSILPIDPDTHFVWSCAFSSDSGIIPLLHCWTVTSPQHLWEPSTLCILYTSSVCVCVCVVDESQHCPAAIRSSRLEWSMDYSDVQMKKECRVKRWALWHCR
jgi:hypothetical protein